MTSTQALAINAKLGMWEWTTTINIPATPSGLPVIEYRSCITPKNMAPKPPRSENCSLTSQTIEENQVNWTMQCETKGNTYVHTGKLTYNGTTAMGETEISSVSTSILGSYVGKCR
ncbi:MAG: hypothetical protein OEZ15_06530 [Gammaproteobacteria bacterium]|nr:hypothetical protein [Gammaproteobacteria bacterium]